MKESELRARAQCAVCGQPIGHGNRMDFYTIRLDHHVLDTRAISRQSGLEMMMGGNVSIAQALGPDEELAHVFSTTELTLCAECAMGSHCIAAIAERVSESRKERPDE